MNPKRSQRKHQLPGRHIPRIKRAQLSKALEDIKKMAEKNGILSEELLDLLVKLAKASKSRINLFNTSIASRKRSRPRGA